MDKGEIEETTANQRYMSTSDAINALPLFSTLPVQRYPSTNENVLNNSSVSQIWKDYVRLTQRMAAFYPQEINTFYLQYLFTLHRHYIQYINAMREGWSRSAEQKTGFKLQPTPSGFLVNQNMSRIIVDKGEQGGCLETRVNSRHHWELNRRRPSVIRRSMTRDENCSSPREAVLSTNILESFGHRAEETKLQDLKSPSTPQEPKTSLASSPSTPSPSEVDNNDLSFEVKAISKKRKHSTAFKTNEPSVAQHKVLVDAVVPSKAFKTAKTSVAQSKVSVDAAMSLKKTKWKFCCFYCKKRFQWFSHCQAHERIHTGERPFKCEQCGRCFTRSDGLQSHLLTHSNNKSFKCLFCSKMFQKKSLLEKHVFEHTGLKAFQCEYCSKEFSNAESIETHLLIHKGEKRFKCQYCNHSFINGKRLAKHIRGHTGEKPFKCNKCNMAFGKKSALIIHHRVHTGVKPYTCLECGKAFSISGNLQRHRLIHTGERPYKCVNCQKTFNNPSHLSRHIKSQHSMK